MTKARSNATANAAKGDLTVGTGTNLSGVLSAGNNGEALVLDSSTATGLRYTAGTVQANPILNSAFQVWQRGTSIACSTTAYTADRWQGYRSVAGATVSRQATGDTTNLPNIQYCARVQRDSGNTSTATIYLAQTLETVNSIPYAGKTVTFSFYARKGANFSGSGALRVTLQQGAGTDQNVLTSMASSTVVNVDATLTTTWQRFTGTGTVNTTSTQLGLYVDFNPTGTAGAADYLEITGVQIDIGSVALPFRTYAGTIQGELAACQRYYYRTTATQSYSDFGSGYNTTTNTASIMIPLPVAMRTTPTAVETTGTATDYNILHSSGGAAARTVCNNVPIYQVATPTMGRVNFQVASGLTAAGGSVGGSNNNTTAYLGWSAEL